MDENIACPVCTLYLRPGITLENHLASHPKQKVIEALIKVTQLGPQNVEKLTNNGCSPCTPDINAFPQMMQNMSPTNLGSNMSMNHQMPTNHSFIYQQFMSSSGTQPILNVNPMNQQFVAVPTVFNPQMVCSPYIFQQQQQVQIVSATTMPPLIPRPHLELIPSPGPAICAAAESSDDLTDPLCTSADKSSAINDKEHLSLNVNVNSSNKVDLIINKPKSLLIDANNGCSTIENENNNTVAHDLIIEQETDNMISVSVRDGSVSPIICNDDEKISSNLDDENEDLNKACQTSQNIIKDIQSINEDNMNVVLITEDIDEFNNHDEEQKTDHEIISKTEIIDQPEEITYVASGSGLQNDNVTILEMGDMNFILPNDFMPNGQSVISRVDDIECLNEANRHDRPQVLMNIGEEGNKLLNVEEDQYILGETDFDTKKYVEEKFDDEGLSRESLNIRADERMPPRGELSEQESNGASEVGWGSRIYQEGSSGMSTSYDLLARESWEASDCSDSEIPPLQSRIPPSINYNSNENEPEEPEEDKKITLFNFSCSTCGARFRCPKERRVHQTKEHASPSNSGVRKPKKRVIGPKSRKNKSIPKNITIKNENDTDNNNEEMQNKEIKVKKEPVLCNTCGVLVPHMRALSAHCKTEHNIEPDRTCKICSLVFPNNAYKEHLRTNHPQVCNMCGKTFLSASTLRLHLNRHLGIRPYKCEVCSKAFFTKQKLEEHTNIHTGRAPIKCTMCDETFRRHSNLVQHRNRYHSPVKKLIRDYICFCGEIFTSKSKFDWHKEVHEAKPKSCIYCYEKFVHRASLTRHIRRAHNQRYVPDLNREFENIECKICKGVYLKGSLEAHLQTHSGKKQHVCPICHKEFTTKWNLKLHKWTHASPAAKPYKCDQCNSAFIRETDYKSHMNSHRSIRPYTCNYCGCKFIRKYNCIRHVREHEEGKSFTCDVCKKTFHRSYYLKEHMRVHSGARPFACHICGKTSTTKSNHNKHMKIHHAREPVMTEG